MKGSSCRAVGLGLQVQDQRMNSDSGLPAPNKHATAFPLFKTTVLSKGAIGGCIFMMAWREKTKVADWTGPKTKVPYAGALKPYTLPPEVPRIFNKGLEKGVRRLATSNQG